MRLGMYVNLAVHVKCLLHFAGFNHNWIMTKLIDFPSNTFRENLLRVRRRDKWKGTERERERETEAEKWRSHEAHFCKIAIRKFQKLPT